MQISFAADIRVVCLSWVYRAQFCIPHTLLQASSERSSSFRARARIRIIPSGADWINCARRKLSWAACSCECSRLLSLLFPSNGSADRADTLPCWWGWRQVLTPQRVASPPLRKPSQSALRLHRACLLGHYHNWQTLRLHHRNAIVLKFARHGAEWRLRCNEKEFDRERTNSFSFKEHRRVDGTSEMNLILRYSKLYLIYVDASSHCFLILSSFWIPNCG
jgi:hypothetical protein